jgi:hypothetical protein
MELEFHQINLRFEALRLRDPRREHQLLASLAERVKLCPVVVLAPTLGTGYVLMECYKRLRAQRRWKRDTVKSMVWALDVAEALLLEQMMRTSRQESPLEQGWLLRELRDRYDLPLEELGRRFERTAGSVSRRLALVRAGSFERGTDFKLSVEMDLGTLSTFFDVSSTSTAIID